MINEATIFRKDIFSKQKIPKNKLIRIVKTPSDEIKIDWQQNLKGRGAYVQKSLPAIEFIQKKNLLAKTLKTEIDQQIYEDLFRLLKDETRAID